MAKLAKTDIRYWQERIFFPRYTKDGEKKSTKEWAVRLQHFGRRETFQLATANKAAAAAKARDTYEHLRAHRWDETLARFKSSTIHRPAAVGMVGDFLSAIRDTSTDNPKTLSDYIRFDRSRRKRLTSKTTTIPVTTILPGDVRNRFSALNP